MLLHEAYEHQIEREIVEAITFFVRLFYLLVPRFEQKGHFVVAAICQAIIKYKLRILHLQNPVDQNIDFNIQLQVLNLE